MSLFLTIWLAAGIATFFLARASWALEFGCKPITIGTAVWLLILMWIPPANLIGAIVWWVVWARDNDDRRLGRVKVFLRTPIINPCNWWSKKS